MRGTGRKGPKSPVSTQLSADPVVIPGSGRPSLRDVVVQELLVGRNIDRPILSRIVFVGEIQSKDVPPRAFFEDVVSTAQKLSDDNDPLGGRMKPDAADSMFISGAFVEMAQHFFLLLESEPTYLSYAASELHQRLITRKTYDGVKNMCVIMAVDDVATRAFPRYCAIEATLPSVGTLPKKSLEELIVDAVHGLLLLGKHLQPQGKVQMDSFLANVKNSNPQWLPRASLVDKCIESGLGLTLEEYVRVYCESPFVLRPSEINHPIEPALHYEP